MKTKWKYINVEKLKYWLRMGWAIRGRVINLKEVGNQTIMLRIPFDKPVGKKEFKKIVGED